MIGRAAITANANRASPEVMCVRFVAVTKVTTPNAINETMYKIAPALEVVWIITTPVDEILLVPPTMLRMRPRVIRSWIARM